MLLSLISKQCLELLKIIEEGDGKGFSKIKVRFYTTSIYKIVSNLLNLLKGIVQPFELGGVTSLIRSAVKFCKAGHFQKKFLMIQSHTRSLKQNSAA
jgi:hypothetical protein